MRLPHLSRHSAGIVSRAMASATLAAVVLLTSAAGYVSPAMAESYEVATQIEQGLGYWAATTGDCSLTMPPTG